MPELVERARDRYSLQSPFLLVNRANWLGPWLERHRPGTLELYPALPLFEQRYYLGVVALAIVAVGGARLRCAPALRPWYGIFGLLFVVQVWLAMGSRTLLWQLARSFGASADTEALLSWISIPPPISTSPRLATPPVTTNPLRTASKGSPDTH